MQRVHVLTVVNRDDPGGQPDVYLGTSEAAAVRAAVAYYMSIYDENDFETDAELKALQNVETVGQLEMWHYRNFGMCAFHVTSTNLYE